MLFYEYYMYDDKVSFNMVIIIININLISY